MASPDTIIGVFSSDSTVGTIVKSMDDETAAVSEVIVAVEVVLVDNIVHDSVASGEEFLDSFLRFLHLLIIWLIMGLIPN